MPYNGRRFNVVRREEYEGREGKKTKWVRVGAAFFEADDSKAMLKIDLFGEPFYLFPQKDEKDSGGYGG